MSRRILRRAVVLGSSLAMVLSGIAAADTVVADGDAVAIGNQQVVHLGEVGPGAVVGLEVTFRLTCKGTSHVAAGTDIEITVVDQVWPQGGSAVASGGGITVPADWPAPGTACPDLGQPTVLGDAPLDLELTAPSVAGTGFEFVFLFGADPGGGVTNAIAFTATLDVVDGAGAPPADTEPPVLADLPADIAVFTPGTTAAVAWTGPTATDDTDPDPQVVCDPASGSSFALGTTTVTCTATDAAGNAAAGTFEVTVQQLAGAWGRPLDGQAFPALTGRLGRTIPLKLTVLAGGVAQGPADLAAPSLRLERLDACAADAGVVGTRAGGSFRWDDAAWHLNLGSRPLAAGCWRLVSVVDGSALASAVIRLTPERGGARPEGRLPPAKVLILATG